ncbi:hypothetical protein BDR26DRAFT_860507 [Obelidium mucronatum]|nr:hypothetical protein BDR26DRAFT_860507 [Obelidium mucronatum]
MNEDSFDDESECFLPGYLQHSRWMQWRESYQWSYASRCSDTTTHWALYGFESKTTLKIPSAIGIMQHLKDIWLEDIPSLVGDLPSSLGQLSCLEWLVITKTNLSGTLPRALGKCRKLRHLDLSRSRLCGVAGAILKDLLLSRNQFHGTCGSVARLAKLQQLDLSCNLLSGPLPNGFGNLHELTLFDVSGNQIHRRVDTGWRFSGSLNLKLYGYDESSAMAHSEEQVSCSRC